MKRPRTIAAALGVAAISWSLVANAEWQKDDFGVAWVDNGQVVWKFSLDPKQGKPYFGPLSVAGGPSLVLAGPEDHPWHYGLWFSWKYVNQANYWEQDRESGRAEGATTWKVKKLRTHGDGAASIRLDLDYTHPSGRVDMKETRIIEVSAPAADGSYHIDWNMLFVGGPEGAVLERTPMPGEPDGRVNGGYAGLAVRLAAPPYELKFLTEQGPITTFIENRARPATRSLAVNFSEGGKPVGAIALLPLRVSASTAAQQSWYVVDASATESRMRFFNQAVLAPRPVTLKPGQKLQLAYRVSLAPSFTPEALMFAAPDVQLSIR